jgi:hypothetical protein
MAMLRIEVWRSNITVIPLPDVDSSFDFVCVPLISLCSVQERARRSAEEYLRRSDLSDVFMADDGGTACPARDWTQPCVIEAILSLACWNFYLSINRWTLAQRLLPHSECLTYCERAALARMWCCSLAFLDLRLSPPRPAIQSFSR